MTRTLVDIPPEKLEAARVALGARSKREAVEMALDVVIRQARAHAFIGAVGAGALADFTPDLLNRLRGSSAADLDSA
jgi:hypothetical protein